MATSVIYTTSSSLVSTNIKDISDKLVTEWLTLGSGGGSREVHYVVKNGICLLSFYGLVYTEAAETMPSDTIVLRDIPTPRQNTPFVLLGNHLGDSDSRWVPHLFSLSIVYNEAGTTPIGGCVKSQQSSGDRNALYGHVTYPVHNSWRP